MITGVRGGVICVLLSKRTDYRSAKQCCNILQDPDRRDRYKDGRGSNAVIYCTILIGDSELYCKCVYIQRSYCKIL